MDDFLYSEPAVVPEPATLLLFGTTAAGLGLARWRRWRHGQQR
ncbi:MAG TPA: PEP-CTERM sorting domain-containing protein [Methylomirabilota bacterium]|nr:PEP-CTERM sorting domain-containing protein [Methylomirabilota bacterium]